MKCEECVPLLEDFVDGEIDASGTALVGAHIASCAGCAAEAEALHRELEIYAHYERDVDVTPALWAGVLSRIEQERASESPRRQSFLVVLGGKTTAFQNALGAWRFGPALAAAALAVVVAGTTFTIYRVGSSPDNGAPSPDVTEVIPPVVTSPDAPPVPPPSIERAIPTPPSKDTGTIRRGPKAKPGRSIIQPARTAAGTEKTATDHLPGQLELVRKTEREYLAVIAVLARDVNVRRAELLPATRERVDNTIAELDRTIEGTRRAVANDPSDPVAVQYLLTAYAKKVEVLQEVASR
jgi:hypothetical protein